MSPWAHHFKAVGESDPQVNSMEEAFELWNTACNAYFSSRGEAPEVLTDSLGFPKTSASSTGPHDSTVDPPVPLFQVLLLAVLRWPTGDFLQSQRLRSWLMESSPTSLRPFWDILSRGLVDEKGNAGWMDTAGESLLYVEKAWQASSPELSLLEWWQQTFYPQQKKRYGVFHTPEELAQLTWSRLPETCWQNPEGGLILDPAAGTQVFVCAALRQLAATHRESASDSGTLCQNLRCLLERVVTFEISAPAWVLGFLEVGKTLRELDCDLQRSVPLKFWRGDALNPMGESNASTEIIQDMIRQDYRWVVGNPPYSSRVEDQNPWILQLLKGQVEGPGGQINYYEAQGKPLGERKSWLHDLYVCFFRMAQWWTCAAETSTVAFVTNRGFIENVTFRGMRESLNEQFDQIDVHDLHGDASDSSPNPAGGWFGIKTLTSLVVMSCKGAAVERRPSVRWLEPITPSALHSDRLSERSLPHTVTPEAPQFEWHPDAYKARGEFDRGWCLTDIFRESGSPIVTARDSLAIAFTSQELVGRLQEFLDDRVNDDVLRQKYFPRSRSRRFPRGDTRGWKLHEAREFLRERAKRVPDLETWIRPIHYRAYDLRHIIWVEELIDWPRRQVMASLESGRDWALVARRQSPVGQSANFFTATRQLVTDGVLRSDNRGNETVFPLRWQSREGTLESNLNPVFEACVFKHLRGSGDQGHSRCGGLSAEHRESLLGYVFAWLHCREYQHRFRHQLVRRYPRVPLVKDTDFFAEMSAAGLDMLRLHAGTERATETSSIRGGDQRSMQAPGFPEAKVPRGWPEFDGKEIILDGDGHRISVSREVWELRIGAHQVARKWLKDRRAFFGDPGMIANYKSLLVCLEATLEAQKRADAIVASAGGCARVYENLVSPMK